MLWNGMGKEGEEGIRGGVDDMYGGRRGERVSRAWVDEESARDASSPCPRERGYVSVAR